MLRGYCIHCGFPATNKCPICGAAVCNNCLESHQKSHESKPIEHIAESIPDEPSPISQTVKAEVKKPGRPRIVK